MQYYVLKWSGAIVNRQSAGCSQTFPAWLDILAEGFIRPTVTQYLWSSQRNYFMRSSPLLLSCITSSLFLPHFQATRFFFSLLCSSRVLLSGPVLPETPRHISSFCLLPSSLSGFFLSLSFSLLFLHLSLYLTFIFLALFLHPTPYRETEREAILMRAQYFLFPLNKHILI